MSKAKHYVFVVNHDKGETVNGKRVWAGEKFKSVMTDEFQEKVDKGFLLVEESKVSADEIVVDADAKPEVAEEEVIAEEETTSKKKGKK